MPHPGILPAIIPTASVRPLAVGGLTASPAGSHRMATKCATCGKGWIEEGAPSESCRRCAKAAARPDGSQPLAPRPPATAADHTKERNVVFSEPAEGTRLMLDAYIPAAAAPSGEALRPAVLLLHGGGWQAGGKSDEARMARRLAAAGFCAICASYRLESAHKFPAQLEDAAAALGWLVAQAARLRVDPARIGVYGYSAGGHLAALLALQPGSPLRCVAAGGAPWDLGVVPNGADDLAYFLGGTRLELPELYARACPTAAAAALNWPSTGSEVKEFWLWHGERDELAPAACLPTFARALAAAAGHVVAAARVLPVAAHLGAASDGDTLADVLRFLEGVLRPGVAAAAPVAAAPAAEQPQEVFLQRCIGRGEMPTPEHFGVRPCTAAR